MTSHLPAAAKPLLLTLTRCADHARALGWTLRRSSPGDSEIVAYPKGTGADAPESYFDSDPAAVLSHVLAIVNDRQSAPAADIAAAALAIEWHDTLTTADEYAWQVARGDKGRQAGREESTRLADMGASYARQGDAAAHESPAGAAIMYRHAAAHFFAAAAILSGAIIQTQGRETRAALVANRGRLEFDAGQAMASAERMATRAASRAAAHDVPEGAKAPASGGRVIDVAPTWAGILPALLAVLENGTAEGQAMARAELARMAQIADMHVAASKGA